MTTVIAVTWKETKTFPKEEFLVGEKALDK